MNYLYKFHLPFVVFLTGACVLIIEIIATRILSPYFGNTIFTFSSVIGTVLAALSAGYYFGGKLADKYPSYKFFYSLILCSGLSILLLYALMVLLLPKFGYRLSIIKGPIVAAGILFFLPALLLGALSPFAVKLQGLRFAEEGIGGITGEIFFWSTLGSIAGCMLAGFVLIPRFGIDTLVLSIALILTALGLVPLIKIGVSGKTLGSVMFLLLTSMYLLVNALPSKDDTVIYCRDGVYEKITINDSWYEGRRTRFFQQDRSNSGAMFLDSDDLALDYTKYYVLYKVFRPDLRRVLVIGGGAYSIPKALLRDVPEAVVDVAEIEPSLPELARTYFKVEKTARLNTIIKDGRRLLHDTDVKYDLIFSDVYYSLYSIPAHFTTKEFFELAKDRLSRDGIFMANVIGDLSRQEASFLMSEMATFKSVFPNSYFFAVESPDKTDAQNIIFAGYNSDNLIDFSDPKIAENENPVIASLGRKIIAPGRFDVSSYPILTDNYAPVEYLTAQILRNRFGR